MDIDVYDFDKLPFRTIQESGDPFRFPVDMSRNVIGRLDFQYRDRHFSSEEELVDFLIERDTTALIIIWKDRIVYESYFNGFERDSLFKSFSVSKSVLSALIGIAIEDGLIADVDERVAEYIPEVEDPGFRDVTIRRCLNNTSGVRYSRGVMPWNVRARMYYTADLRAYNRTIQIEREPGKT